MIFRIALQAWIIFFPIACYAEGCDPDSQSAPHLSPLLGTMAGVKLSIPRTQYGGPSIHYGEDKEYWGSHPNRTYALPEQNSIIRDFIIGLNRSTFRQICSKADLYSYGITFSLYGDDDLPSESNRWLEFVFVPRMYSENDGRLQRLFGQQINFSAGRIGPLHGRPNAFGLRKLSSDQEAGSIRNSEPRELFDTWYFDDERWTTLIACARQSANRTPNKISCIHYFTVPELKTVVYVRYIVMADVSDWKRIEAEARKVAVSYIVRDPAP